MSSSWQDPWEPPRARRRWTWLRFALAAVLVISATAATVATGALLEVKAITDALHQNPRLDLGNALASADAGAPQTLLLVGSDSRSLSSIAADRNGPPHSDTMLLVRLDPSKPSTTMLSIPRDLLVTIDPPGAPPSQQKINAAYSLGGDKLTAETVEQVFGVSINHVIDINFQGFQKLVEYVHGVYVQVDRRYYHSNAGLPPSEQYSEINIQPGYQRLDGPDALAYVRYRHTDTDLVRSARQQDFLRQIKNQLGIGGIVSRRQGIEQVLGGATRTDIRSSSDVLKLLELVVQSANHPIRQVNFQRPGVNLDAIINGGSFVTATPQAIHSAISDFLNGSDAPPADSPASSSQGGAADTGQGAGNSGPTTGTQAPNQLGNVEPVPASDLVAAKAAAPGLPFPLLYPRIRDASVNGADDLLRTYQIRDQSGNLHHAYVAVFQAGGSGEYYDVQGMDWTNPPILAGNSSKTEIGGRTYRIYPEGQHVRLVAWREHGAVYWVVNTLQDTLSGRELLAIAQQAAAVV